MNDAKRFNASPVIRWSPRINGSHSRALGLAKAISIVCSPPLLGLLGLALLALELNSPSTWWWMGMYAAASILAPVIYLLILMRAGLVSDFHMSNRLERISPMKGFLLFLLLSWLVFRASNAPFLFQVLALAGSLQAAGMLFITLRWKIQRPYRGCGRLFRPSLGSLRISGCTRVFINPLSDLGSCDP